MNRNERRFTALLVVTRATRNSLASLLPPLIPILTVALEYPLWQLGLLVSIFTFGSGLGQAPVGHLSDTYDRRYILPTGLSISGAAYLLFAAAPRVGPFLPAMPGLPVEPPYVVMCVAMLLVGLGTSTVHPTAYPMITANVREQHKGKVLGLFGSSAKYGDAAVPLFVGVLVLTLVWDQIIALVGAFGLVFGLVLFVSLRGFDTDPGAIADTDEADDDSGGARGPDAGGPDAPETPAARDEEASVDAVEPSGEPSADESVWQADRREYVYPMFVIYLFFVTRGFAGRGVKTFVPAFIVGVYGYTLDVMGTSLAAESVANFYFSALLIVGASTQIAVGYALGRYDARTVLVTCMLAATAGILGLAVLDLTPLFLLGVLFVVGVGIWGLNPARDMLISEITPAEREGRTFGYLWTANHLTGAAIPALVGYMGDVFGLRFSFAVLAIGSLLAAGSVALLYSDRVYVDTTGRGAGTAGAD